MTTPGRFGCVLLVHRAQLNVMVTVDFHQPAALDVEVQTARAHARSKAEVHDRIGILNFRS